MSESERQGRLPLPSGTELKGGDYVLREAIGCGSFGIIYAAEDTRVGQSLAVKEFFPTTYQRTSDTDWSCHPTGGAPQSARDTLREQFKEEFLVQERFERSGIVKVYNLFEDKGGLFLVMERLFGATVDEILKQHGSLEEDLALWIVARLIETLEGIHFSGLTHGDIKPDNIFLNQDCQVLLLDFGAVNHYLDKHKSSPRFLTPGYAPPEQYHTQHKPNPSSDLYAVGATLYEILTNCAPPDAIERTKGVRLPSPNRRGASVSPPTLSALGKTLALTPEKRPSSCQELSELLPKSEVKVPESRHVFSTLSPWLDHKHSIRQLQLTKDGKLLASADKGGGLRLWSTLEERCLGAVEFGKEILSIALSPDDSQLAIALIGGRVELLEFSTGRSLGAIRQGSTPVGSLSFTPDGKLLVCGLFDGQIELRDLRQPNRKKILTAHSSTINNVSWSPSGRLMSCSSNDRSVSIWDFRSYRRIRQFQTHRRAVQSSKFSLCGRFLFTAGSDMSIRVYDVKRGDELRRLKGHEAMIWALIVLEQKNLLLSCSADRSVRLWDMSNFREVHKLQCGEGWLSSMVYDQSRHLLFVAGVDKAVHRIKTDLN